MERDIRKSRIGILRSEKSLIIALRFVVWGAVGAFLFNSPNRDAIGVSTYIIFAIFVLSNFVFMFERSAQFLRERTQTWIFLFDIASIALLVFLIGERSAAFYVVYPLAIFVSAISRRTAYAFVTALVIGGLYAFLSLEGVTTVEPWSGAFFTHITMFFVTSVFVGHLSEEAEKRRTEIGTLVTWKANTETRALEQDRRAAVGLLTAGVAHKFNNFLAAIRNRAELAIRNRPDIKPYCEPMITDCDHAAKIVQSLLTFSDAEDVTAGVPLRPLLQSTLNIVSQELKNRNIKTVADLHDTPLVKVSPAQVQHALLNILLNAVDAMPSGGTLTVRLAEENSGILIAIADTGCGIPEQDLRRVFDPFFTTKGVMGGGTTQMPGLGLAVAKNTVERFGGHISIQSVVGEGTTVEILLPTAESTVLQADGEATSRDGLDTGPVVQEPEEAKAPAERYGTWWSRVRSYLVFPHAAADEMQDTAVET